MQRLFRQPSAIYVSRIGLLISDNLGTYKNRSGSGQGSRVGLNLPGTRILRTYVCYKQTRASYVVGSAGLDAYLYWPMAQCQQCMSPPADRVCYAKESSRSCWSPIFSSSYMAQKQRPSVVLFQTGTRGRNLLYAI